MKEEIYEIIKWCLCFVHQTETDWMTEAAEIKIKYGCEMYHAENITDELLKLKYSNIEELKTNINTILIYLHISSDTVVVDAITSVYIKYMRNDKIDKILKN